MSSTTITTTTTQPETVDIIHLFTINPRPNPAFLTLPLELRLEIYSHLLTLPPPPPPSPIYRSPPSPPRSPSSDSKPKFITAIIRTCRQTHHEAQPLLYTLNTFTADPVLLTALPSPLVDSKFLPLIRNWSIKIRLDSPLPPSHSHSPSSSSSSSSSSTPQSRSNLLLLPLPSPAELAAAFSGAHSLTVTAWQASYMGGVGASQLSRFEKVRGVKRAKIQGVMPGFGRYARWLEGRMMLPFGGGNQAKEGESYVPEDEREARRLSGWS
ncbi:hypothetical protein QBC42DRAFT_35050 [Cladorrhinum samala]|uniref:Uncharacterized protein n=1 Tax=Cladorrhinum samala TaxID=585594 RepID=A0AAV9HC48_9PEZI|nr:hypothetical protein QBC42DRAFT_35050 [Cladorrhinum samala]